MFTIVWLGRRWSSISPKESQTRKWSISSVNRRGGWWWRRGRWWRRWRGWGKWWISERKITEDMNQNMYTVIWIKCLSTMWKYLYKISHRVVSVVILKFWLIFSMCTGTVFCNWTPALTVWIRLEMALKFCKILLFLFIYTSCIFSATYRQYEQDWNCKKMFLLNLFQNTTTTTCSLMHLQSISFHHFAEFVKHSIHHSFISSFMLISLLHVFHSGIHSHFLNDLKIILVLSQKFEYLKHLKNKVWTNFIIYIYIWYFWIDDQCCWWIVNMRMSVIYSI